MSDATTQPVLTTAVRDSTSLPHILFTVIDDLGYNDMGPGSEFENTLPRMKALADEGVHLDNYYTASTCTPARSALHTGTHWVRNGLGYQDIGPTSPFGLSEHIPTVAELLQKHGNYETHLIGKWDLGHSAEAYWPTARGFDTFYGLVTAQLTNYTSHEVQCAGTSTNFLDWHKGYRSGVKSGSAGAVPQVIENAYEVGYSTKLLRQKAVGIIEEKGAALGGSASPLYLFLAFNGVHSTVSIDDDWARTAAGAVTWADIRLQTANDSATRAKFAGALWLLDDAVGQAADALRRADLYGNSVTVVVSDNGASVSGGGNNWPLRGQKGNYWDGCCKVRGFVHSPLIPAAVRGSALPHLFHVTDWGPTVVAGVAGLGGVAALGGMDGINQVGRSASVTVAWEPV